MRYEQFTSYPSQKREGWCTRAFLGRLRVERWDTDFLGWWGVRGWARVDNFSLLRLSYTAPSLRPAAQSSQMSESANLPKVRGRQSSFTRLILPISSGADRNLRPTRFHAARVVCGPWLKCKLSLEDNYAQ